MPVTQHPRRNFLRQSARLALAGALLPLARPALANTPGSRILSFDNTHTGEQLSIAYSVNQHYVPRAMASLNHFLRDHYTGTVGHMDPKLFDLLFHLQQTLSSNEPIEVICGYRCSRTNRRLRAKSGGVAKHSLHMVGKAIDIRVPDTSLTDLRDAAISLGLGGVGYYPESGFVHVDTGKIRTWEYGTEA